MHETLLRTDAVPSETGRRDRKHGIRAHPCTYQLVPRFLGFAHQALRCERPLFLALSPGQQRLIGRDPAPGSSSLGSFPLKLFHLEPDSSPSSVSSYRTLSTLPSHALQVLESKFLGRWKLPDSFLHPHRLTSSTRYVL